MVSGELRLPVGVDRCVVRPYHLRRCYCADCHFPGRDPFVLLPSWCALLLRAVPQASFSAGRHGCAPAGAGSDRGMPAYGEHEDRCADRAGRRRESERLRRHRRAAGCDCVCPTDREYLLQELAVTRRCADRTRRQDDLCGLYLTGKQEVEPSAAIRIASPRSPRIIRKIRRHLYCGVGRDRSYFRS